MSTCEADSEIRARLAANDSSALDLLWTHYASDLFGYLVSILRSRHDAEDALQEVFVTIARKRSAVAKARKLKPYLFRLSRNVAYNRIKRSRRRREREVGASHWIEPIVSDVSEDRIEHLEAALAGLPEKQRSVIVLKYFHRKTFREIADMLSTSVHTAASRYRYGMAKLKEVLGEDPP